MSALDYSTLGHHTVPELKNFLRKRKLKVSGNKSVLVDRLREALKKEMMSTLDYSTLEDHTVTELKNFLRKRKLKVSGTKSVLIDRLREALEKENESDDDSDDDSEDEKDDEDTIFDQKYPQSTLSHSHFLKIYDNANKHGIKMTREKVRNCLPYDLMLKLDVEMKGVTDISKICIWLWSLGSTSSGLYKLINTALYQDNQSEIARFMPIIRGLNQYLVRKITTKIVTWRGSKMTKSHFQAYRENHIFRCPAIVATSLDFYEAKAFRDKYMIKFIIPIGAWNAAEITPYSHYKTEKEVLLPPYTAFKVLKINKSDNLITVKILDNKKVSLDVPTVFI